MRPTTPPTRKQLTYTEIIISPSHACRSPEWLKRTHTKHVLSCASVQSTVRHRVHIVIRTAGDTEMGRGVSRTHRWQTVGCAICSRARAAVLLCMAERFGGAVPVRFACPTRMPFVRACIVVRPVFARSLSVCVRMRNVPHCHCWQTTILRSRAASQCNSNYR